jgi:hypothetical protein
MQGYTPEVLTVERRRELRAFLRKQLVEIRDTKNVTCTCGHNVWQTLAFRCFYCGLWFCSPCARVHFNVPDDFRKEWIIDPDPDEGEEGDAG